MSLPGHLIADFWVKVRELLKSDHLVPPEKVDEAIESYRDAMDRHQAGESIYHWDPERIAKTVAGGWKSGFSDPAPTH